MGDDDCFESDNGPYYDDAMPTRPGYGWVGDLRLDLPLDEDDYLMPSPQNVGPPTVGPSHQHYMELVADNHGKRLSGRI